MMESCDIERLGLISVGGLSMDGAGVEGCQMKLGDRSVATILDQDQFQCKCKAQN